MLERTILFDIWELYVSLCPLVYPGHKEVLLAFWGTGLDSNSVKTKGNDDDDDDDDDDINDSKLDAEKSQCIVFKPNGGTCVYYPRIRPLIWKTRICLYAPYTLSRIDLLLKAE